jgi:hypothetical protein
MRLSVLICILALAASQARAAGTRWIGSWGASPAPAMAAMGDAVDLSLFR